MQTISFVAFSSLCISPEEDEIIREMMYHDFSYGDVSFALVHRRCMADSLKRDGNFSEYPPLQSFLDRLGGLPCDYVDLQS